MDAYRLRLEDHSLDIPPFLQRKADNTWRYPQMHDGTLYTIKSRPSLSSSPISVGDSGRKNGNPLPTDPQELLSLVATLPRGAPPPLKRDDPREIVRREIAYARVNKILAKKEPGGYSGVCLEGREALKFIRGDTPCAST